MWTAYARLLCWLWQQLSQEATRNFVPCLPQPATELVIGQLLAHWPWQAVAAACGRAAPCMAQKVHFSCFCRKCDELSIVLVRLTTHHCTAHCRATLMGKSRWLRTVFGSSGLQYFEHEMAAIE